LECSKDAGLTKCPVCRGTIVASIYVGNDNSENSEDVSDGEEEPVAVDSKGQKKEPVDVFALITQGL